jgi:hypothetical protein
MITKRGKKVIAILLALGFALIVWLVGSIHWTGSGYCFGSFDKCYPMEFEKARVTYETL